MIETADFAPAVPTIRSTSALARLIAETSEACLGSPHHMAERITHALQIAIDAPDLLTAAQVCPQPNCYARHVVHADPKGTFTIVSIVWGPGQFSPVHAHHTWCAYGVRDGDLTETLFAFDIARQQAVPLSTQVRHAGYACLSFSGLDQIHRLGNAGERPAVSVHIYGVDAARVSSHVNRVIEPRQ